MAVYNSSRYLHEQMDSLVNQTYPVFELIVQDDNSTDDSVTILEKYASLYPYIRVFKNKQRKGVSANFFSAMEHANGEYIAIADADDIWERDKLEKQAEYIGDNWICGGFSKPFSTGNTEVHFDPRLPNCCVERVVYTSAIHGHTMLIHKKLLELIPNSARTLIIYDQLLQIVACFYDKVTFCPYLLVNQRRYIDAKTYIKPLNYKKNVFNGFKTIKRTLLLYRELRPEIRDHFKKIETIIKLLPNSEARKKDFQKMVHYQTQKGIFAFIKLSLTCAKLRDRIFYVNESNPLLSVLRALYFPVSCSDYFRYKSKHYSK